MHSFKLGLSAAALISILPAAAQQEPTAPPPIVAPQGERFALQPIDGGVLRLNKDTGAVSYCSVKEGVSICRLSADERTALEGEIERLRAENARLKVAANKAPQSIPDEQQFERVLTFTERFLRRIMRLFREEAPSDGGL